VVKQLDIFEGKVKEHAASQSFAADNNIATNLPQLTAPDANLMLEALTPRLTRENVDSERLEFLGDSLLKLITTVEVFRLYPTKHEGFLTNKRSKVINNAFLTDMAVKIGIDKYLRGYPLSNGKQNLLVRPPGMSLTAIRNNISLWNQNVISGRSRSAGGDGEGEAEAAAVDLSRSNNTDMVNEAIEFRNLTLMSVAPTATCDVVEYFKDIYTNPQQENAIVKSKALADLMEAIIGSFFVMGGVEAGAGAIKALGAWPTLNTNLVKNQPEVVDLVAAFPVIDIVSLEREELEFPVGYPEPLKRVALGLSAEKLASSNGQESKCEDVETHSPSRVTAVQYASSGKGLSAAAIKTTDAIEVALGYRFKNWKILDEALTHCSIQHKPSNQRLEFLGDAVLDFAVVTLLFNHQRWASQGDLSGQKSNSTCNKNLGRIGALLGLYKHLDILSTQLEYEFVKVDQTISALKASEAPAVVTPVDEKEVVNDESASSSSSNSVKKRKKVVPVAAVPVSRINSIQLSNGPSKALADVVEALFGAAYLDSGGSIAVIEEIVKHIHLLPQLEVSVV